MAESILNNEKSEKGMKSVKCIALTGIFAGVAIVGSMLSVPVLGAKCAPVQHIVNIISGIVLGPWYALAAAFIASVVRNLCGLGTLLAFPGSMCGAFLAGVLYRRTKKLVGAYIGELFGTSIIGGFLSYPIAVLLMGNTKVAIYGFVIPFFISSFVGTVIAIMITKSMDKSGIFRRVTRQW